MNTQLCSLDDAKVRGVLDRLHREARSQKLRLVRVYLSYIFKRLLGRTTTVAEEMHAVKDLYLPLSQKQGTFCYLVARSIGARRIVEFGTSFGISTIYLAAAVRDNGGGVVIGSELEPQKVAGARANLAEAGLSDSVEIREGDARDTLRDPGAPVDMVLMDGAKQLYLPVIQMLAPHLRRGAVVISDNIYIFKRTLAPYVAHMRDTANGFGSVTLFLTDGTEFSVRL